MVTTNGYNQTSLGHGAGPLDVLSAKKSLFFESKTTKNVFGQKNTDPKVKTKTVIGYYFL